MSAHTFSGTPLTGNNRYIDDNSHVAVVTQAVVQDVFWLHQTAEVMKKLWFPVYFVPRRHDESQFFVIIPMTRFREWFDPAWRRLAKNREVVLLLRGGEDKDEKVAPVQW